MFWLQAYGRSMGSLHVLWPQDRKIPYACPKGFRKVHVREPYGFMWIWYGLGNSIMYAGTVRCHKRAFVAGWLQGHWWGFISRNYVVWPTFLLMNVFIALKGSHFWILFDFTAAGVVPCGGRKTSPCTSTIVQFIFYFDPLRSAIIFWEIRNKWLFKLIF